MSIFGVAWRQASCDHVTDYITYMLDTTSFSAATIRSRISAIAYFYKIKLNKNIADNFASEALLKNLDKSIGRRRKLLPINKCVLDKLLRVVYCYERRYLSHAFYVMYYLLYYLALRISEVLHYSTKFNHALRREDIKLSNKLLTVTVRSGKHNVQPMNYEINCTHRLYWHLTQFLKNRGSGKGPLFCFQDGKVITRSFFTGRLKEDITALGLDAQDYNSHSFRIGRTSDLAVEGASDRQIALIGRWRSDAFRDYIRPTLVSL